jgi:DNA-binding PadR family transcriptional regulator
VYIDILILEQLTDRPRHGYEIRKVTERILGFSLNSNTLYPALKRFEEMGAVRREVEPQEGRPDRFVYHLTEVGREVLQELLREFPPEVARDENEFQVRVALFHQLDPSTRQEILTARRAVLEGRMAHLDRMLGEASASGYPYATQVVEFNRRQIQSELEWIEELSRHVVEGKS